MISDRCLHYQNTPVGERCQRCEEQGVGMVALDGEGIVTFLVPVSEGLSLQELRNLVPKEVQDEALVRRKLMTEEELEEAMLEPYEEDPEAAEEDALEEELVWKLSQRLTDLVGDMWGIATLYVVPEPTESSWARTLLSASPEEVRAALEGQTEAEE